MSLFLEHRLLCESKLPLSGFCFLLCINVWAYSSCFKSVRDPVSLYAFGDEPATGYTRGAFLLIALLSGGDYDAVRSVFYIRQIY